jgi:hypothetical protein
MQSPQSIPQGAIRIGERGVILVCSPYARKSLSISPNEMRVTVIYSHGRYGNVRIGRM